MNYIGLSSIFLLFHVSLFLNPIVAKQVKRCTGTEVRELPDGCTIIEKKPLVFKDVGDDSIVRKKVEKLTQLEAGLEVIETDLETFDYLKHVNEIVNSNGPAMIFRRNKKLKRLNFNALNKLKGGNIDIVLEDDHYAEEAGDGSAGFNDLMMLESVSRKSDQRTEKCSNRFLEVKTTGGSSSGVVMYLGYFLIALFVILVAAVIILTIKEWKTLKAEKGQVGEKDKKNKKHETKKKKKSESQDKKAKKTATKGSKSNNTPVKENPKKK